MLIYVYLYLLIRKFIRFSLNKNDILQSINFFKLVKNH